jgi:hypothetical protein
MRTGLYSARILAWLYSCPGRVGIDVLNIPVAGPVAFFLRGWWLQLLFFAVEFFNGLNSSGERQCMFSDVLNCLLDVIPEEPD